MAASPLRPVFYEFGDFRIDTVARVLTREGEVVPLTPKVFDLLQLLVENSGQVVVKERLMNEIWPDTFVEEGNLAQNIWVLRKSLDLNGGRQYIQTIPRRGYRFAGKVRVVFRDDEELIIEERTRSRIVIDQSDPGFDLSLESYERQPLAQNFRTAPWARRGLFAAGAGLCVLLLAGAWYSRRQPKPPITRSPIKTIAVLPFKPLSNEGREEYLELGIADALITRLSSIKQLRVRPTGSVRKFAGTDYDPIEAGRELKTDAVIDGSIQRLGERLRINVQLIRISDSSVLWGYHCDDLCTDLFSAQDSISENVARSLALTLSDVEGRTLTKRYTTSSAALRAYLKARYFYARRTKEAANKTVEYLQEAVALDPQYALAYAALAEAFASTAFLHVTTPGEAMPKAKEAVEQALKLDPNLGEAHSAAGFIKLTYDWDWNGADVEFKRALELNPNESVIHDEYATLLEVLGRTGEAIVETNKARELDPLSLLINRNDGRAYYYARQYDRAIQIWEETAEMDRSFPAVNNWLAMAYEADGRYQNAINSQLKQEAISGATASSMESLRRAYASGGWKGYWQRELELHQDRLRDPLADSYEILQIYRRLGNTDEAFRWLNKACDDRSVWMIWIKVDPSLDGLRSDPRFTRLLDRLGLGSHSLSAENQGIEALR